MGCGAAWCAACVPVGEPSWTTDGAGGAVGGHPSFSPKFPFSFFLISVEFPCSTMLVAISDCDSSFKSFDSQTIVCFFNYTSRERWEPSPSSATGPTHAHLTPPCCSALVLSMLNIFFCASCQPSLCQTINIFARRWSLVDTCLFIFGDTSGTTRPCFTVSQAQRHAAIGLSRPTL